LAHIRFRKAWAHNGHTVAELPYKAAYGVYGSWLGLFLNVVCLIASFYSALFPPGGSPDAEAFFQSYLAAPMILLLYLFWKAWSWTKYPTHRAMYVPIDRIDIYTGMRDGQVPISAPDVSPETRRASIQARDQEQAQIVDNRPMWKKALEVII